MGREHGELGWMAWALGVVGLWLARHGAGFDPTAVWPPGIERLLARNSYAVPSSVRALVALALAAAWIGAGRRCLQCLGGWRLGRLEEIALGGCAGLGIGGTAIAWLGLAGLLSPGFIGLVCAGWGAVALIPRGAAIERPAGRDEGSGEHRFALALALLGGGVALGAALVHALAPPWAPDALYYQLTLPRLYLEQRGFVHLAQEPVVSGYPGLGQMYFAIALSAGWDDLAAVASWLHGLLLVAATGALGERVGAGALAPAAAVAALPTVAVVAGAPLVDLITAFHLTVALLAAWHAWHEGGRRWTVVAGLAVGFALGNKYLALPAAGLLAGAVVAAHARQGLAPGVRHALLLAGALAIGVLPWGLKNLQHWGTPLFPLHCPASAGERVCRVVREHQRAFVENGQATPAWRLPFDVTFDADPDDIGRFQGEVGPLLLALAAVPFVTGRPRGDAAALAGYALALALVWAAASRQVRFVLPAVPALAVAVLRARPWPRALGWVMAAGAWGAAAWTVSYLRPGDDLAYVLARETPREFYRSLSATASLLEAFERLRGEPPGTVAFFWEYRGYQCPRPFLPEHAYRLRDWPRDPRALLARLQAEGVSHLLVNRTIWREETAGRPAWEFGPTLDGLCALPGVRQLSNPTTRGPQVELWRLPPPR